MAHINFKLDDEILEKIDAEAERTGVNKSEFYRACLENGFDQITEFKSERKQILVSFYIENEEHKKLLTLAKKYKLNMYKVYNAVFQTGFDVLNSLNFLGFMRLAQGILKVDDLITKIIKK